MISQNSSKRDCIIGFPFKLSDQKSICRFESFWYYSCTSFQSKMGTLQKLKRLLAGKHLMSQVYR